MTTVQDIVSRINELDFFSVVNFKKKLGQDAIGTQWMIFAILHEPLIIEADGIYYTISGIFIGYRDPFGTFEIKYLETEADFLESNTQDRLSEDFKFDGHRVICKSLLDNILMTYSIDKLEDEITNAVTNPNLFEEYSVVQQVILK